MPESRSMPDTPFSIFFHAGFFTIDLLPRRRHFHYAVRRRHCLISSPDFTIRCCIISRHIYFRQLHERLHCQPLSSELRSSVMN